MGVSQTVYIYCDFCEKRGQGWGYPGLGEEGIRTVLKGMGWTRPMIDGKEYDRCQWCTRAGQTKVTLPDWHTVYKVYNRVAPA